MNEKSNRYIELENDDKKYIWHPFTQMEGYLEEDALVIEKGDGNHLIDVDGNKYIDGVSSLWTNVHGHKKDKLDKAIKDQVDKISHSTLLGISNVPAIECAKKLVEITPNGLNKVFYSDSGSTSVEIALKMAFQYYKQSGKENKKTKFISMKNSYHGDTIGSVSVGGIDIFHQVFGKLLFQSLTVDAPYCYRCPVGKELTTCNIACLEQVEETMAKNHKEVAALVIEPLVQGAAGILTQPEGYIKRVRELCNKYNILMIADEVAVGFGKTGKMFACEKEDVVPDIMTVAKGISGGYLPLAATITTDEIYNGFLGKYEEFKTFFHGHTYTGNPLACAVAIANMEIFEEENVLENLQDKIKYLSSRLELFKELQHVGDVRQQGVMIGIELVKDKETKEDYSSVERIGHKVILESRKNGLLIRPLGNVIVLMPPLSITMKELEILCDVTYNSIKKVTENAN